MKEMVKKLLLVILQSKVIKVIVVIVETMGCKDLRLIVKVGNGSAGLFMVTIVMHRCLELQLEA